MKLQRLLTTLLFAIIALTTWAQAPTVSTDTRFARGATMAFGRIKTATANGNVAIQRRGLCLAENPNPTVDDILSTKTITNNGTIYYFENLKPGTMYYMRAYATNKDGETGYGEVIKFATVPKGAITCSYTNGGDEATNKRINSAKDQACEIFSNLTSIHKGFGMGYSPGTPTADCAYKDDPWINMGASASYQRTGTLMHEMEHGLGVIPYSTQWNGNILRSGNGTGQWLGDRVSAFLDFWDNTTGSHLNGDTQHMWPYGINGAQEDDGQLRTYYANALIAQALGEDGLQHTYSTYADPCYVFQQEDDTKYYLKCESEDYGLYTSYLKSTPSGNVQLVAMTAEEAAQDNSVAWHITFTPKNQYYQLRNVATGQYLTYDSGIATTETAKPSSNEDWHLMMGRVDVGGRRGYWIIHPEANWQPHCLQAASGNRTTAATFDIANGATQQRWLILTADELATVENSALMAMKSEAVEALDVIKALAAVPHQEDVAGTDDKLQTTIEQLEARIKNATSPAELQDVISEALKARTAFLQSVTPIDEPFDLTYMLTNPTVDTSTEGWSLTATVSQGCAEFYQKTFDFNQTVKNLPKGTYKFTVQAFQRPGSVANAANNKSNGTVYAGTKSAKMLHITDGGQAKALGKGREKTIGGKNVPDDMTAAAAYFQKGYYLNEVLGTVGQQNGSIKVGIKTTSMPESYWCCFDDFHLYFYGSRSISDVTAISDLTTAADRRQPAVYDLQGRRVSNPKRGLYIVNGRKVLIK